MEESLRPFFEPKGVVIVGASQHPQKLGYGLARNLVLSNYPGGIHFVNPKGGVIFDREVYPSVAVVPDPVDLAVLLVPAGAVPQTLKLCGQRGIPAAIIASGGFRETGEEGAKLEEECLRIAKEEGIRLFGPNCIGLLDTHFPLDTTFLPSSGLLPGSVAFISHSGAICSAVLDWARGQGFGISRLVSLGNQLDVNETDVLQPVASDPYTRVLTMYLEGVGDGRKFVEQAMQVSQEKPIVALKVGRFESGRQAVASHTGALAGQENAFSAAFRRAGVLRAEASEEVFDWARALAWCPLPKGRNVAILTNAGGPGVTGADALEANGLRLATLSEGTKEKMRVLLPPAASVANPVDILASGSPDQYRQCLEIILTDPNVDSVLVILPSPPMFTAAGVANAMSPVIQLADKPVVVALMGELLIQEAVHRLRIAGIPEYRFPERAASALAILSDRADIIQRGLPKIIRADDVDQDAVRKVLAEVVLTPAGFVSEEATNQIMVAYGLPVLQMQLAETAERAVQIAEQIGYPVVLKIASPDIPHKSDIGGVLLNLNSPEAVSDGFYHLKMIAMGAVPEAEVLGAYVQQMVPAGQEVILGAVQDPQFGALAMFGSGGVEVEGLEDVAFALAPVAADEIEYMLGSTWAGKKLKGFRNLPPSDQDAVEDAIIRLAQLAADFPQLAEIEINPLRVLPVGQGAVAVDIRIKVAE